MPTFVIWLLPLIPLFWIGAIFNPDWVNHLWMTAYFGEYFRQHFSFPTEFMTEQAVGYNLPLFYGVFFYPIAGLLSSVMGTGMAIRLLAIAMMLAQFYFVRKLFTITGRDRLQQIGIPLVFLWSVYPMTNLYNRGALTEFFATGLLTCAIAAWLCSVVEPDRKRGRKLCVWASLFFVLMCGTHPITAFYGGLLFAIVAGLSLGLIRDKLEFVKRVFFITLVVLLTLAPWLLVSAIFHSKIDIGTRLGSLFFFPHLHDLYVRLMPIPFDYRTIVQGVVGHDDQSPYLEAQFNVSLLLLSFPVIQTWFSRRKRPERLFEERFLIPTFLGLFFVFFLLSVARLPWIFVPRVFYIVQYPYRLVTYQNLTLLLAFFFAVRSYSGQLSSLYARRHTWVVVALTLSFVGIIIKIPHAFSVARQSPAEFSFRGEASALLRFPKYFPQDDYVDASEFSSSIPKDWESVQVTPFRFMPGVGSQFGRVLPQTVTVQNRTILQTNVVSFPWNRILVNGEKIPNSQVITRAGRLGIALTAGTYELEYRMEPLADWRVLRRVSLAAGWVLLVLGCLIGRRR